MGTSCGQCSHKYYFAEGIFCFCRIFLNLGVVLLCFSFDTPMAYPSNQWMSRSRVRCFEQVRVFRGPQNAEGVPISLVKWGWGGPHITRDMGTGVPISRGSPYRAYTVFKKLLSEGVGAEVRHHEAFMPEDEDVFWDKGVFATDSHTGLQNAIFYYTGKNLCLRGRDEHRNLKRSQFVEIEGGYRYVERGSKTFRGGFSQLHLNGKSVVLYNDADAGMRCYCSLLRLYLSKLPSDTSDAFNFQPVKGAPKSEKWCCNTPVGRNKLATMVKRMCEQAGLKPKTNHSLRATGATTLFNAGVPEKLVQKVTGHRSIECLRRYEKTSEQHKRAVSRSLTSRQKFESQSLDIKRTVDISQPLPLAVTYIQCCRPCLKSAICFLQHRKYSEHHYQLLS